MFFIHLPCNAVALKKLQNRYNAVIQAIPLWLFIGTIISALFLSIFFTRLFAKMPTRSMGGWGTDHIVHISISYASWFKGFDLLRYPAKDIFVEPSDKNKRLGRYIYSWGSDEIFTLAEDPSPILFPFNWSNLPRPYPPGAWLYHLPEAIGFRIFGIDMKILAAFAIIKYLLVSHIAFLVLFKLAFEKHPTNTTKHDPSMYWWTAIFILIVITYQLFYWSLSGFYEVVAILFLLLSIQAFCNTRNLDAIFWYALALFLNFRCLWLFSIPFLALIKITYHREWKLYSSRQLYTLGAGIAFFAGISIYSLLLLLPSLNTWPLNNPMYWRVLFNDPAAIVFPLILLAIIACLALRKHWIMSLSCLNILIFLHTTHHSFGYHTLFILPLFAFALKKRSIVDCSLACLFYGTVCFFYLQLGPFHPLFFKILLGQLCI